MPVTPEAKILEFVEHGLFRDAAPCGCPSISPEIPTSLGTVASDQRHLDATELVVQIDQPIAATADEVERAVISHALTASKGNSVDTVKMLGLSRKGLCLRGCDSGSNERAAPKR